MMRAVPLATALMTSLLMRRRARISRSPTPYGKFWSYPSGFWKGFPMDRLEAMSTFLTVTEAERDTSALRMTAQCEAPTNC
jgi:hypothetical protein